MVLSASVGEEDGKGIASVASLLQKATQIILGSRTITRDLAVSEENPIEHGIDIPTYKQFSEAFWSATDQLLAAEYESSAAQLFLYIYTEKDASSGIKTKVLLEKWILTYTAPSETCKINSFDCPESVQLLRCLMFTTRLFPAFYLSKDYSTRPNQYEMSFAVSNKAIVSPDFNTPEKSSHDFPSVKTDHGTLSIHVDYRNSCTEYSKYRSINIISDIDESYYPQSQIMGVKEDKVEKPKNLQKEPEMKPEKVIEPEPNTGGTQFYSCLSNIDEQTGSVSETILSSSQLQLEDSVPIPPEIKEFQQTIANLQEMEMFKNTATYNLNDLKNLKRFEEIMTK